MADAQALQSDAQSLGAAAKGDARAQVRAKIKADWEQFKADRAAKKATLQADWQQLHSDLGAARSAKAGTKADREALRQALQQMHDAFEQGRAQLREADDAAHAALQAVRAGFKHDKAGSPISAADAKSAAAPVAPAAKP